MSITTLKYQSQSVSKLYFIAAMGCLPGRSCSLLMAVLRR